VGIVSPVAGFVFLAAAFGVWRLGVRRYASTGS
jgi:ABC-2 type transport system permease protein